MKLINKTILYYLIVSIPLILLAGVLGYFLIKVELNNSMEESLWKEKLNAEKIIKTFNTPHVIYLTTDSLSKVIPVFHNKKGFEYKDSIIYDCFEEEYLRYRVLKHYFLSNNQNYLIITSKSTLEDDDLMESLFTSFIIIIISLIISFFIVSWLLSKTIWRPFYNTLIKLTEYDINQHHSYQFDKSSTKEFNQLNSTLTAMTDKLYSDFLKQKEFTENASHEMQTPLAVVKANLSLLMQSPNLMEEEMNQLQSIENTIKKLTALNKALILLSKIENHQFNENISVNFNDKIKSAIKHYDDLLIDKNLIIETSFDNDLIYAFNSTLADVLISNLLQNAIRHNYDDGGIVKVSITNRTLSVSNSGEPLSISKDELFTRFKKNDGSKESLGLGLSIVKSIASLYNINVSYDYTFGKHIFTLKFN